MFSKQFSVLKWKPARRGRCHFVCLNMPQPAGLACSGTDATVADECHGAGSGRHRAGGGSFFFQNQMGRSPVLLHFIISARYSYYQQCWILVTSKNWALFHLSPLLCAESFRHWWLSIQGIRKSLHIIRLLKPPTNEGPKQRPQRLVAVRWWHVRGCWIAPLWIPRHWNNRVNYVQSSWRYQFQW